MSDINSVEADERCSHFQTTDERNLNIDVNRGAASSVVSFKDGSVSGEKIFLDLKENHVTENLEKLIKKSGGFVEKFLSREVTCIVTNRTESESNTEEVNHHLQQNQKKMRLDVTALSRGKALLLKSNSTNNLPPASVCDPIKFAHTWKIPVIGLSMLKKKLKDEMKNYKQTSLSAFKSKQGLKKLDKNFVKFEDALGMYRTNFKIFDRFPTHLQPFVAYDDDDAKGGKDASKSNQSKVKNKISKQNKSIKNSGFCECCDIFYDNLKLHLESLTHAAFAECSDNFTCLDKLVSKLPSLESFSQSLHLHDHKRSEMLHSSRLQISDCLVVDMRRDSQACLDASKYYDNMISKDDDKCDELQNATNLSDATECLKNYDDVKHSFVPKQNDLSFEDCFLKFALSHDNSTAAENLPDDVDLSSTPISLNIPLPNNDHRLKEVELKEDILQSSASHVSPVQKKNKIKREKSRIKSDSNNSKTNLNSCHTTNSTSKLSTGCILEKDLADQHMIKSQSSTDMSNAVNLVEEVFNKDIALTNAINLEDSSLRKIVRGVKRKTSNNVEEDLNFSSDEGSDDDKLDWKSNLRNSCNKVLDILDESNSPLKTDIENCECKTVDRIQKQTLTADPKKLMAPANEIHDENEHSISSSGDKILPGLTFSVASLSVSTERLSTKYTSESTEPCKSISASIGIVRPWEMERLNETDFSAFQKTKETNSECGIDLRVKTKIHHSLLEKSLLKTSNDSAKDFNSSLKMSHESSKHSFKVAQDHKSSKHTPLKVSQDNYFSNNIYQHKKSNDSNLMGNCEDFLNTSLKNEERNETIFSKDTAPMKNEEMKRYSTGLNNKMPNNLRLNDSETSWTVTPTLINGKIVYIPCQMNLSTIALQRGLSLHDVAAMGGVAEMDWHSIDWNSRYSSHDSESSMMKTRKNESHFKCTSPDRGYVSQARTDSQPDRKNFKKDKTIQHPNLEVLKRHKKKVEIARKNKEQEVSENDRENKIIESLDDQRLKSLEMNLEKDDKMSCHYSDVSVDDCTDVDDVVQSGENFTAPDDITTSDDITAPKGVTTVLDDNRATSNVASQDDTITPDDKISQVIDTISILQIVPLISSSDILAEALPLKSSNFPDLMIGIKEGDEDEATKMNIPDLLLDASEEGTNISTQRHNSSDDGLNILTENNAAQQCLDVVFTEEYFIKEKPEMLTFYSFDKSSSDVGWTDVARDEDDQHFWSKESQPPVTHSDCTDWQLTTAVCHDDDDDDVGLSSLVISIPIATPKYIHSESEECEMESSCKQTPASHKTEESLTVVDDDLLTTLSKILEDASNEWQEERKKEITIKETSLKNVNLTREEEYIIPINDDNDLMCRNNLRQNEKEVVDAIVDKILIKDDDSKKESLFEINEKKLNEEEEKNADVMKLMKMLKVLNGEMDDGYHMTSLCAADDKISSCYRHTNSTEEQNSTDYYQSQTDLQPEERKNLIDESRWMMTFLPGLKVRFNRIDNSNEHRWSTRKMDNKNLRMSFSKSKLNS